VVKSLKSHLLKKGYMAGKGGKFTVKGGRLRKGSGKGRSDEEPSSLLEPSSLKKTGGWREKKGVR